MEDPIVYMALFRVIQGISGSTKRKDYPGSN